jgi:tetratricopeptide (TPR) repeat protein
MSNRDEQKRKRTKKTGKSEKTGSSPSDIDALMARRLVERDMAAIQKLIDERKFKSLDELNEFIQNIISSGELAEWVARSPWEKAQELIYQAWDTSSKKQRVKLARQALKICPDCADAYVLLAEDAAQSVEETCKFYQAGVEAGERALGDKMFTEGVGHFWGILETRPYMRARAGLAQCLWELGRHEEAVGHYRDMLRLNPGDNQGIRYLLAACLLEMGEVNALQELLGQYYNEPTAAWLYTGAVVTFLQEGDSLESRQRLLEAIEQNRYVVPYLLGEKRLPKQLPEYMSFGDKDEAIIYCAEFGSGWYKARGAISWLESVWLEKQEEEKRASTKLTKVPEAFLRAFEAESSKSADANLRGALEGKNPVAIYTFKVSLKEFSGVWRKIEIKGSQTLHHLHKAIFKAFERYDEHLYAFFLSNKPWDSSSEYGLPDPESDARNAERARIDSLGLQVKKRFLYLFDFGDEWWHSIELVSIKEGEPKGRYPRIVESKGEAPPQYPPCEDE